MISKSEIKKIRSLNTKKGRELCNLILIEGKRLVNQVMHSEFNINNLSPLFPRYVVVED